MSRAAARRFHSVPVKPRHGGFRPDCPRGPYDLTELLDTGDPWRNLALAVVVQSAEDYYGALVALRDQPHRPKERRAGRRWEKRRKTLLECEEFFRGAWYPMLTEMSPQYLRKMLMELAEVSPEQVERWCGHGAGDSKGDL